MKKYKIIALALLLSILLCACAQPVTEPEKETTQESAKEAAEIELKETYFTDRDLAPDYNEAEAVRIQLKGDSAASSHSGVKIQGQTVTIHKDGVYLVSGNLTDGSLVVNTDNTKKTTLIFDSVKIESSNAAPLCILSSEKVFLALKKGSENALIAGDTFQDPDAIGIDGAIFSKEDLTLSGEGKLLVESPAGHGIVCKDSLRITGGEYEITAAFHGICANDEISVKNASFSVTAGKDGFQCENTEDVTRGFVHLESGKFHIESEGDGISASSYLQILDGEYDLLCGGGSVNAQQSTSDRWGDFMQGGRPGGMMKPGGNRPMNYSSTASSAEDSTSIKGLKADGKMLLCGGKFTVDSADDTVHAGGEILLAGGSFTLASGDDGIHSDTALKITGGEITITKSYEGLEALNVTVAGGKIYLVASDDGINAAGGTDQSGFGGPRGQDRFGGGFASSSKGSVVISGGDLYLQASGDGIDANGSILICGGYTVVCGPNQGDTATLDYDTTATIEGGTFIGTGASGMAQSFSDTKQGVVALRVGTQNAKTALSLTDENGKFLLSITPELNYSVVILSSPEMTKGQSCILKIGDMEEKVEIH